MTKIDPGVSPVRVTGRSLFDHRTTLEVVKGVLASLMAAALTAWSLLAVGTPASAGLQGMGDLNRNFGNGGISAYNRGGVLAPTVDDGYAIGVQTDGKVVVAGQTADNGGGFATFLVLRYLPNGTLDPTFGTNPQRRGVMQVGFGTEFARATGVAIDSLGRILVGGTASDVNNFEHSSGEFAITRLLSNGAVDTSFGTNGRTRHDFSAAGIVGGAEALSLAMSSNDRPLMVGQATESAGLRRTALVTARYTSSGSLDNTYSGDGLTIRIFADTALVGTDVAIGWGYEVFVSVYTVLSGVPHVGVAKLTSNGANAIDFGHEVTPGFQLYAIGGSGRYPTSIVIQDGGRGRLIVGAKSWDQLTARTNLIGIDQTTGDVDESFGASGVTSAASNNEIAALALTSDDAIVASGATGSNPTNQMVAMYSMNGTLLQNFGVSGYRHLSNAPLPNEARAVAVGPGNLIYTAGAVDVPIQSVLTTSYYSQPQPIPNAPRINQLVRRGGTVVVHFSRSPQGADPLIYQVRHRMVQRNGAARPFGPWRQVNVRQVVIRTTAQLPGFDFQVRGVGEFGAGAAAMTSWRITQRGSNACQPLNPNRIIYENTRNVRVLFPRRSSRCADWRLANIGQFRTLPVGSTQLRTPRVPVAAPRQLIIRRGAARTIILLRAG